MGCSGVHLCPLHAPRAYRVYAYMLLLLLLRWSVCTGAKVDDEVGKEDGVRDAVEDDPVRAEVVVEERYRNRKHDEIRQKKNEHEHVPVESK